VEEYLWRVDLGWMPGAHQAAPSIPCSAGQGGEKKRWKKLVGQHKGSPIKQKKRLCMEAKENERYLLTSHQQAMSSHFPGSRVSVHLAVAP